MLLRLPSTAVPGVPGGIPAPAGDRRGGRRRGPALGLAALVLAGHAWLIDAAVQAVGGDRAATTTPVSWATARPAPLLVRRLEAEPASATPVAAAVPVQKPGRPGRPGQPDQAATPAPDGAAARRSLAVPTAAAPPQAGQAFPPERGPAEPAPPGPVAAGAAVQPPPLYPTRLPEPVALDYDLQYHGQSGTARLLWQHDGQRYRLVLDGRSARGDPLVAQVSEGALAAQGLAPERLTDRRRAGRTQAANFLPQAGQITFSGTAAAQPAWPGAQDRLSWLVQLAAVLGADPVQRQVAFQVADARGGAGTWLLQRQADETGPTPWGEQALQHWRREPAPGDGLRVEAWLPADPATPGAAWPVRLRFTALRSGDVFELQLQAPPRLGAPRPDAPKPPPDPVAPARPALETPPASPS